MPLHTPAHKGVAGPDELDALLTSLGLACDLPSMEGTDSPFHPTACLAEAQALAAELWGAAETFFLVNGSTIGIEAAVLAAVRPGEKILMPRHVHLSVHSALVLSGARPEYLPTRWIDRAGPVPPTADEVERCLRRDPEIRAVLATHPTYYGVAVGVPPLAQACRRAGVPLLVDEAHGAHLRFLPDGAPPSALDGGADVVVQSAHKTVGSLGGTALLHRGHGGLIPAARLQTALNLLQSTSSSYLLMVSLDLVRRTLWRRGRETFTRAVERARALRERVEAIGPLSTARPGDHPELGHCALDPLRLVVDVGGLGHTGFRVEHLLAREHGVLGEFCDSRTVTYVLGPEDDPEAYARLERGLRAIAAARTPRARRAGRGPARAVRIPPMVMIPREAALRPTFPVPLAQAAG
ncbi:MAG TPA: aminotransferase class I/II-fold pyridoxal phosphate-dependent enzyme, partial [Longimicrobium sp.]|nr:aminotransferase class I/II-fold pyridoxal phosphate-dependent enzyme [Longimicrobium sp.]